MDLCPVTFVKDDSGAYAVFTEQGSSASQMMAAKVMDVFQGCQVVKDKPQRHCLYPGQNGRCDIFIEDPQISVSRYLDTYTKTQMA